jgi:hypothetical protein
LPFLLFWVGIIPFDPPCCVPQQAYSIGRTRELFPEPPAGRRLEEENDMKKKTDFEEEIRF